MCPNFWLGKRVFLTGHTGFKGSWLSMWLQELGAEVTGFSLPAPSAQSLFNVTGLASTMHSVIGDIRAHEIISCALQQAKPDIVIHMAAQALVRYSYENPIETYGTNVMGLVNVLEAVRQTPSVRAIVNVTSDKCYQNQEWQWGYRENEAMGGHDPYSSSKGCAELITSAYRSSYFNSNSGVSLGSARAGNVIGGGDWASDRLIPDMMRAISQGKPILVRNPNAVRPWQHVLEPLSGYLRLAERLYLDGQTFASGWNFGPNQIDAKSVKWIVEHLIGKWTEGVSWQLDSAKQPHEAHYLKLDCAKANSLLDWHPRWNLAVAIDKIIEWHHVFMHSPKNMRALSVQQIIEYSKASHAI